MTLAAQQNKAAKDIFWLLEIELGMRIDDLAWTQVPATEAWWIVPVEGKPSRIRTIDRTTHVLTELEEKASQADVEANPGTWFYDTTTGRLYIRMTTTGSVSEEPGSGAYYAMMLFWRLFCDGQRPAPNEIVYNGRWYDPRMMIDSIPSISVEIGSFLEGGVRQTWGSLKLANGDGQLDVELADYIWENKIFILKAGSPGDTYAQLATISRGRTGSTTWTDTEVTLGIEDPLAAED